MAWPSSLEERAAKRPRVQATATCTGQRALATDTLKWSAEGRLAWVTSHAVNVLTPTFMLHSTIKPTHFMTTYTAAEQKASNDEQAFPYVYATIEPKLDLTLSLGFESLDFDTLDAGLALPSHDRPPVRQAEWSPLGFAVGNGCYLSVLMADLTLRLWQASPSGWTGSWNECLTLHVPETGTNSKREAFLDAQIVSHRWTQIVPSEGRRTCFLLASTRSGRVVAWQFREGVKEPVASVWLASPPTIQGHMTHILDCDKWTVLPAAIGTSQAPATPQQTVCSVALWCPANGTVAWIEIKLSVTNADLESRTLPTTITQRHCVVHGRFIAPYRFALATPGAIDLITLRSGSHSASQTFVLDAPVEAATSSLYRNLYSPVLDVSADEKGRLRALLSDGSLFQLPEVKPNSSVGSGQISIQPLDERFTIHLNGQADGYLQEEISTRRPLNGLVCLSPSRNVGHPRLLAVAQDASELATVTRRQNDKRANVIALMLTAPLNVSQIGPSQQEGIRAIVRFALEAQDQEQAHQHLEPPNVTFSPILAFFLGAQTPARDAILKCVWLNVQPYIDQWTATANKYQLRCLHWLLTWLQSVGGVELAQDVKVERIRIRQLILAQNLLSTLRHAAQTLSEAPLDADNPQVKLNHRFAANAFLLSRDDAGQAQPSTLLDAVIEALGVVGPNSTHADAQVAEWDGQLSEKGGLSLGESCPACGEEVLLKASATSPFISRCKNKHVWKRCVLSLELLSEQSIRLCTGCGVAAMEASRPSSDEPTTDTFKKVLSVEHCPICACLWRSV